MFVPRALRLKGIKEPERHKAAKPPATEDDHAANDDALVDAMQGISTGSPEAQQDVASGKELARGPRFTVKPVTPEYIAQLAAGIELIFSDYAHREPARSEWLRKVYRTIDGEQKCASL